MALTNAGRNLLAQAIVGEGVTAFNNANAYIGVGDSNTAFAATQTDLAAGANKFRKAMDATFPTRNTNVLTYQSTFATGEANFAWEEWGVFNAAAAGTMLNRKVETLGTKANTQSWQFTVTITVVAA
jgi:hypothetical protein